MQKRAFSVIELVVSAVIIGVIAVVGIQSARKAAESYDNYFYAAYDILSKAVYNAYLERGDGMFSGPRIFCEALTGYINTTQETCDDDASRLGKLGINTATNELTFENQPSFIAANGMAFYVGRIYEYGNDSYDYESAMYPGEIFRITPRYRAGIIAVDLNGNKRPNTHIYDGRTLPDRVFFVVTNVGNGSIFPIGLPDIDRRYFQVRVVLPEYRYECNNPDDPADCTIQDNLDGRVRVRPFEDDNITSRAISKDNPMINKTPPMSLHEARIFAWGSINYPKRILNPAVEVLVENPIHEGFYETQPMSYHPLSTNLAFAQNISCADKPIGPVRNTCKINELERHAFRKVPGLKQITAIQNAQIPANYYGDHNSVTINWGHNFSETYNSADFTHGCTPNNSECYIVPLRN